MTDFSALFADASRRHGVPVEYLQRTAQIESSMNPAARNPRSSAGGLFQFIDSTARQYGLQDRFDPVQATDAAARLAADNARALRSAIGRDPTPAELYLAHQQGAGGATRLLANPTAPAASIVGEQAIRLNGGRPGMTAGDFANLWINKFGNKPAAPAMPGAPGPQQMPQMAAPQPMMGAGPPPLAQFALAQMFAQTEQEQRLLEEKKAADMARKRALFG